jgi:hypothetical protein
LLVGMVAILTRGCDEYRHIHVVKDHETRVLHNMVRKRNVCISSSFGIHDGNFPSCMPFPHPPRRAAPGALPLTGWIPDPRHSVGDAA